MHEIRLENYRCFRERQTARLAPLTLLVGENSSGKTSFLAMARILSDIAYTFRNPDFKEDPYDLGSFDEIAHHRGARGGRASEFKAGFSFRSGRGHGSANDFEFTFGKRGTTPVLVRRRVSHGSTWIDEVNEVGKPYALRVGTYRGSWEMETEAEDGITIYLGDDRMFQAYHFLLQDGLADDGISEIEFAPLASAPTINRQDIRNLSDLERPGFPLRYQRPFASAPVRSKPRRTYDPARPTPDPEGDYTPMYLADLFSEDRQSWTTLKDGLEDFGRDAGLFDEISIRRLGRLGSDPFQVQVRKFGGGLKGPMRNLIDVGYGVSQILPVITEMLRSDAPPLFLLQQPEVHLHPMAQAALGSLFCRVAGTERQIIVETHSDHLMDRVRMDVRDGIGALTPDDVSILYFERDALDVHIHSLRIDEDGNILGAPDSYRQFFMEETARDIWPGRVG